jgi:hypothetical protein
MGTGSWGRPAAARAAARVVGQPGCGRAGRLERADRLSLAFHRQRRHFRQREVPPGQIRHGLVDQDLARGRGRLKVRREVDHITDDPQPGPG